MYLKNSATPEPLSVVVLSSTTGEAITSGVSVKVDGTAGGGTTTYNSNDSTWSYTPTQAETNADSFRLLFAGTGAISVAVNVHTTPVDLSLLALSSEVSGLNDPTVSEIVTGVEGSSVATNVTSVLADTGELQTDWADGGRLDLLLDSAASGATILPVASTVAAGEVSEQELTLYVNTAGTITISVVDSTGAAIDLSSVSSMRFVVYKEDDSNTTVFTVTESDISVGGASDNQVTITYTEANTATAGTFRWNLRDEDTPRLLAHGAINLDYSKDVT